MRPLAKHRLLADEAIVLRVNPVGEGDAIVTLLAKEAGKIHASVKRVRSVSAGFAGRFEPLSRIVIRYEPGTDLQRLREASLVASAFRVASNPALQPFSDYLAELADAMLPEKDPSPKVYRLLSKAVAALQAGVPPRQVARYVEYWVLRLSGHVPDESSCCLCGRPLREEPSVFLGRDGLVCASCNRQAPGERLRGAVLNAISELRQRDIHTFAGRPLPEPALRELARFSRTILREILGRDLRCAAYLRRYHHDDL